MTSKKRFLPKLAASTVDYYSLKSKEFNGAQRVGWRDEKAQTARFKKLCYALDLEKPFTITDLGCGMGAFLDYLRERTQVSFRYTGYDLLDDMIHNCKKGHADSTIAEFIILKDMEQVVQSDYTVASGIFNLKGDNDENTWLDYIKYTLSEMHQRSKKGFAANFLTRYSDPEKRESTLYYADPLEVFDYVKRELTSSAALLHDYQEYDFTIAGFI